MILIWFTQCHIHNQFCFRTFDIFTVFLFYSSEEEENELAQMIVDFVQINQSLYFKYPTYYKCKMAFCLTIEPTEYLFGGWIILWCISCRIIWINFNRIEFIPTIYFSIHIANSLDLITFALISPSKMITHFTVANLMCISFLSSNISIHKLYSFFLLFASLHRFFVFVYLQNESTDVWFGWYIVEITSSG